MNWISETDADGVAWLTFDTADSPVNVLSRAALQELSACLTQIEQQRPRALVLRSAKASGFIAGADIKEFTTMRNSEEGLASVLAGQAVLDQLARLPFPSVAAIQGFALGGGLELALACTYRVGADDGKLSLGLPEVQLGLHPGFGGTVRSVRLIGVRPAMDLMLKGKPFNAARARSTGLVDLLVPAAELLPRAKALGVQAPRRRTAPAMEQLLNLGILRPFIARQLTAALRAKVIREHYPAPYAIVDLWRRYGASGEASFAAEAQSIAALMGSPTTRNLIRVFMLQDRLKGLGGKSDLEFRHVHVIGAGVMGGDIAAWSAMRGMTVTLQDRSAELIAPAIDRARTLFEKRSRDPAAAAATLARLSMDVEGRGAAQADVVIEAIYENAEAKRALYAELEPRLKPAAIFATNTSSLTLESLSSGLRDPGRLVGIHFFNPVAQMQLVEIVQGEQTHPQVAQSAASFVRKLDKLPLPCRSAPGFVVNRILMPYINEAIFALEEGIAADTIDAAGKQFGMPMGPIELADVVGLDVCLHVGNVLAAAFGRRAPQILVKLVADKQLGRKSGQGFYTWRDGKPVRVRRDMRAVPADLEDRLMLPMLNEAVACLRERVIADADLLDAGAIFATGFAPFRGGPLQYARSRGIDAICERLTALAALYGERFQPDPGWQQLKAGA
ncbi:MAG: 3-hydroxyacyl-CoA dehydrogenase NAD-binding domain-containing protein [Steroidobacterales bacterium]